MSTRSQATPASIAFLMDSGVVISISTSAKLAERSQESSPRAVASAGRTSRKDTRNGSVHEDFESRCAGAGAAYRPALSVPQLVAALQQVQRQRRQAEAENPHDHETRLRRNVGQPEKAVAKAVDHIEERVEMRQRL